MQAKAIRSPGAKVIPILRRKNEVSDAYKQAGVDIAAGNEAVERMKKHVKTTFRPEVLTDLGGFGALFGLNKEKYEEPVLVSGTDGVGTKLKIAFAMDKHDTIGVDAVAMCVNDIIVQGAEPLFFLDYLACDKVIPEKNRGYRQRHQRRLRTSRRGANRRRNGRDAGYVQRRRV